MDYITREEKEWVKGEIAKLRTPETLVEGKWNVSPLNRDPEVLGKFGPAHYPPSVMIRDDTLRTIEQTPGICLSAAERRRLAVALVEAGVKQLHTALLYQPTQGLQRGSAKDLLTRTCDAANKEVEFIKSLDSSVEVIVGANNEEEIDAVADSAAEIVQLFPPVNPALNLVYGWIGRQIQRAAWRGEDWRKTIKPPLTVEENISWIQGLASHARKRGLRVALATPQLYNSSLEQFKRLCEAAAEVGIEEIGLGDGASAFGYEAYAYLVSCVKEWAPGMRVCLSRPFNAFGLAMAKAIAGVHAGADVLECSVNGLCTGAGQVDLPEAVATLEVLYGVKTGIKMEMLTPLKRLVEDMTRVPMAQSKPVTGEYAWTYTEEANTEEDDLGLGFLLHKCVDPAIFGNSWKVELGRYSGTWTMMRKLRELGLSVDQKLVPVILDEAKQEMELRKRLLTANDLKEIVSRVQAKSREAS
ncbi:MAG: hypothetical protein HYX92_05710 [Chloroflexi bacterium]|nr:hypothetical protein [Chloroflexota bacterium]